MRRALQGRAGTVLAVVAGMLIASAATAGAAHLITGKQIRDGSVGVKDLSPAVQRALAQTAAPGPPGAPGATGQRGETGAAGRSALTPLQSGETIVGGYDLGSSNSAAVAWVASPIPFPGPPKGIVITEKQSGAQTHCPGDIAGPRADPGYVCVYEAYTDASLGSSHLFAATYEPAVGRTRGFALYFGGGAGLAVSRGVWAYTAP